MEFLKYFDIVNDVVTTGLITTDVVTTNLVTTNVESTYNRVPILKDNRIQLSMCSIQNVIFSLGCHERDSYHQLFFPFYNGVEICNTVVFGIDPEYNPHKYEKDEPIFIKIKDNQLKFRKLFNFRDIVVLSELEQNIHVFIIPSTIETDYRGFRSEAAESFAFTRDCSTSTEKWVEFYRLIEKCIVSEKRIYINNWVFTNSRYFKLVNGVHKCFYKDIGHFFEYFPEMGFLLNQLYGCWHSRNEIKIGITVFTNKMTIVPIERTELSLLY